MLSDCHMYGDIPINNTVTSERKYIKCKNLTKNGNATSENVIVTSDKQAVTDVNRHPSITLHNTSTHNALIQLRFCLHSKSKKGLL